MYDLFHIQLNIRKNVLFYLLLLCELVLCLTMCLIGLDEQKSYLERVSVYTQEEDKKLLTLTNQQLFLPGGKLKTDDEVIKRNQVIFGKVSYINYQNVNGEIKIIQFVEVTPSFFETYFNIYPKINTYYATEAMIDQLQDVSNILGEDIKILNNHITIKSKAYSIEKLTSQQKKRERIATNVFEENDIIIDKAVFYLSHPNSLEQNTFLFLKIPNTQNFESIVPYINQLVVDSPVYPTQLLAEFQKGSNQLAAFVRLFGWVSVIALIIIMFGFSATLIVFMTRRKQNMRIQYIFGASHSRLKCQIFGEVLCVQLVALCLSMCISAWIEPKVSSIYYMITPHIESVLTLFSILFVLSIVITTLISYENKWTSAMER
ncbi:MULTISPECIES: FtsX-like permease family protein [unclassified Granulicatella]|uniref:FtsX-like permease family protein n=1 Tax=unclassified Granulicatella TaxID=2630493 RepID=UPI00107333D7|nr:MULTISPECIES: FtsX-like permease family protein [unclassified Granulicatella]MBF0780806.1 FtsX-like permease family protein [Granulicatella sp. 19428wC4_WM01]TFU93822.1 ABC transporter permease [Granulicatella sp. WM01]